MYLTLANSDISNTFVSGTVAMIKDKAQELLRFLYESDP